MAFTSTPIPYHGLFLLLLPLLLSITSLPAHSFVFDVGGGHGWAVPSNNSDFYNRWAGDNRFQVGDTLAFRYKKDSVMQVMEEDYSKCRSTHPIFFSNNGKTEFRLDRPGPFYFISGAEGHCERGQKVIIKVIAAAGVPGGSTPDGGGDDSPDSDAARALSAPLPVLAVFLTGSLPLFFFN
ncbi:hypothetical protein HPP92_011371 [Vanilla planifolia]|uniref:Phytocyanin domain-containing protein n=1 Tax=Vanilla planifolia TaxID=51239 RepID=A0A835RBD1_VANPL|nr:hypothetical protein HPP92_011665 [Vanilla planifolia]KAG0483287.1 hypothetical protein HPP92_011371 [Vanilla planifolia]